jgi:hypothetical protein
LSRPGSSSCDDRSHIATTRILAGTPATLLPHSTALLCSLLAQHSQRRAPAGRTHCAATVSPGPCHRASGRRLHLFTILALAAGWQCASEIPGDYRQAPPGTVDLQCIAACPGTPTRAPAAPSQRPHPKSAPSPAVVDWLALGCVGGSLGQGIVKERAHLPASPHRAPACIAVAQH